MNKLEEAILKFAKEEFIQNGYENATLRNICKKAGCTTGAMYKKYKNKDELFYTIIEPAILICQNCRKENVEKIRQLKKEKKLTNFFENTLYQKEKMMELMYSKKEEFKILLCSASGNAYEKFLDDIVEEVTKDTALFYEDLYNYKFENYEELHIIITAYYSCLFEPIKHDFEFEKALDFCKTIDKLFDFKNIFKE